MLPISSPAPRFGALKIIPSRKPELKEAERVLKSAFDVDVDRKTFVADLDQLGLDLVLNMLTPATFEYTVRKSDGSFITPEQYPGFAMLSVKSNRSFDPKDPVTLLVALDAALRNISFEVVGMAAQVAQKTGFKF
jgi:hypothetical protein